MFFLFDKFKSLFAPPEIKPLLDKKKLLSINQYLNIIRPNKKEFIHNKKLVAIDFETTGLNPKNDEIISMGFCPIKNDVIRLADCVHITVKTDKALMSDNVVIHGLTDDMIEKGLSQEEAFLKFIELTEDKIIIAHSHSIERRFIQKLARQAIGRTIPLSFIDTLIFAKEKLQKQQPLIKPESLRLFNLRKQHGLPNYKAHNALEDAISTAELYMVQKASLNISSDKIRLKNMNLFNYKS